MKRSEALALIDKVYGDWVRDWLDTQDLETLKNSQALNERILSALELAGMLPPRHFNVPSEVKEEPYMPGYHGINGWEPEDER